MAEIEYDPSGKSNSLFQVGDFKCIFVICKINVFPCVINT